jgi:hypothetical protein
MLEHSYLREYTIFVLITLHLIKYFYNGIISSFERRVI